MNLVAGRRREVKRRSCLDQDLEQQESATCVVTARSSDHLRTIATTSLQGGPEGQASEACEAPHCMVRTDAQPFCVAGAAGESTLADVRCAEAWLELSKQPTGRVVFARPLQSFEFRPARFPL